MAYLLDALTRAGLACWWVMWSQLPSVGPARSEDTDRGMTVGRGCNEVFARRAKPAASTTAAPHSCPTLPILPAPAGPLLFPNCRLAAAWPWLRWWRRIPRDFGNSIRSPQVQVLGPMARGGCWLPASLNIELQHWPPRPPSRVEALWLALCAGPQVFY